MARLSQLPRSDSNQINSASSEKSCHVVSMWSPSGYIDPLQNNLNDLVDYSQSLVTESIQCAEELAESGQLDKVWNCGAFVALTRNYFLFI